MNAIHCCISWHYITLYLYNTRKTLHGLVRCESDIDRTERTDRTASVSPSHKAFKKKMEAKRFDLEKGC